MTDRSDGQKKLGRRDVLKGVAGLTFLTTGMAPTIVSGASDELVVNTMGGELEAMFNAHIIPQFEKKFGVKVHNDASGTSSEDYAKIRASRGSPGFDVACVLNGDQMNTGGNEGLLEKITESNVPNIAHCWHQTQYGAYQCYQFNTLCYDPAHMDAPDSWADYWMPGKRYGDKAKGKLLAWHPVNTLAVYTLIKGAQLAGGGQADMAPVWDLLEKQKPYQGAVARTSPEAIPLIEDGQITMFPYWNARASMYIAEGKRFKMVVPKEGGIVVSNGASVPIGAKNKKLAFEFVNFMLDKEQQRNFCLGYHISPARKDIADWPQWFVDSQITTQAKMSSMEFPDSAIVSRDRPKWTLKWQEVMG